MQCRKLVHFSVPRTDSLGIKFLFVKAQQDFLRKKLNLRHSFQRAVLEVSSLETKRPNTTDWPLRKLKKLQKVSIIADRRWRVCSWGMWIVYCVTWCWWWVTVTQGTSALVPFSMASILFLKVGKPPSIGKSANILIVPRSVLHAVVFAHFSSFETT